jgi:hypothetical protein
MAWIKRSMLTVPFYGAFQETRRSYPVQRREPNPKRPRARRQTTNTRLNGEKFHSTALAKTFVLKNLPVYCQSYGTTEIERLSDRGDVERFFFDGMSVDHIVFRKIGMADTWNLANPRLAALGLRQESMERF